MLFLSDLSKTEIGSLLTGEPSFRAKQIFEAVHRGKEYPEMTNVPAGLKGKLFDLGYGAVACKIIKTLTSVDGTKKFLFELFDGNVVEGVLMKYKYGFTQCVSTQVGCRMGCKFCASGLNGLVRNLSVGEILGQIIAVNRELGGELGDKRKITNVVLMGSGEPFDNYVNVVKFLRVLSEKDGLCISPRNISVSTSGLVDKIYDFLSEEIPVNLTISLHSPFDEERKKIMPVANAYKIADILAACDAYFSKTGRRYIFEYVLIRGENDGDRHANELIRLLRHKPCHVNLIRLNTVKENTLKAATDSDAYRFLEKLTSSGLSATVRRQMGVDIEGACGQLRQKYIEKGL